MMTENFSKRLPLNIVTNIAVFVLSTAIGLFMTPFLLKYTGLDGFGLVRLALTIPVYITLITLLISGAVSRFLTIDLQKNDRHAANTTFNTAFFSMLAILLIVMPIIFLLALNADSIFNVPNIPKYDSNVLFIGILSSALINVFMSMFMIPAFAKNKLYVINLIRIFTLSFQTVLMVSLIYWGDFPLASIGLAHISGGIVGLIISVRIWQKFAPSLSLNIRLFNVEKLKVLSSMGGWLMVDQIGTILFLYVDLIVVNYLFGASATGEYSIPLQWQTMIRSLAAVLAGVVTPMILLCYANQNIKKLVEVSCFAIKYIGLGLAFPIGLICGFAPSLLTLWVGEEFVHLVPLLWLMIFPMVINLALLPLFSINTAFNKLRIPAYVTILTGILSLMLALLLTAQFHLGLYGVALAGVIAFSLRNLCFSVVYIARITGSRPSEFYSNLYGGLGMTLIIFSLSYCSQRLLNITGWLMLLTVMALITLVCSVFVYKLTLNLAEQQRLISYLKEKVPYFLKRHGYG